MYLIDRIQEFEDDPSVHYVFVRAHSHAEEVFIHKVGRYMLYIHHLYYITIISSSSSSSSPCVVFYDDLILIEINWINYTIVMLISWLNLLVYVVRACGVTVIYSKGKAQLCWPLLLTAKTIAVDLKKQIIDEVHRLHQQDHQQS